MTEDKGAVSDKKAADTAEAYEKASGQDEQPAQDFDPVIDSINAAVEALELDDPPEPAPINPDFEAQKEEAWNNRDTGDTDGDDDKPPAKKTAAKKS